MGGETLGRVKGAGWPTFPLVNLGEGVSRRPDKQPAYSSVWFAQPSRFA